MQNVLALVLGGGRGQRLFPLTQKRSKPAVPFGGHYRLIDVSVSACINSGIRRIFVLTQFNSESLNKHVTGTYKFDMFSEGFVSVLAAEQTDANEGWFQGTADAVRRCLRHLGRHKARDILILAGDQLYQMDFRAMLDAHRSSGADATVGVLPVAPEEASAFGILRADGTGRIVQFEEKPPRERLRALESELPGQDGPCLVASMGIYVFRREVLEAALTGSNGVDFGRHILPAAVHNGKVQAFVHRGYWRDLGTIQSYYEANLALAAPVPSFDFYNAQWPIFTHPRFLPATKVESCSLRRSLVSEGCILQGAVIEHSVLGVRARVAPGVQLRESLLLGADEYETLDEIAAAEKLGVPPMGVGEGSVLERVIVDKNARIGRRVRLVNDKRVQQADGPPQGNGNPMYFIRDGILVVPKGAVIPDGTEV